jgi:uncharacterized membrane protein
MLHRLRSLFDALQESFWFLPLVIVTVTLAVTLPAMIGEADPAAPFRWAGLDGAAGFMDELADGLSPAGARVVLAMIAGGMVTVVSIVFSLSFVALTLISQQLGPRIIDFWLRAPATKWLLGLSLSAFFCALAGLLGLSQDWPHGRTALLAVFFASSLGGFALVHVVLFATRMSDAIRADATVERLGDAFVAAVRAGATATAEELEEADALDRLTLEEGREILCPDAGYLDFVHLDDLAAWAADHDLRITLLVRENDHLLPGRTVARVVGAHGDADGIARAIRARMALVGRRRRTRYADFEGDALTEVALRALSPSLNDPFTAMACIDRIAHGCGALARSGPPTRLKRSGEGVAVLTYPASGAAWMAPRLLHPIIEAAKGKAIVLSRLAQALAALFRAAGTDDERRAVERLFDRVARLGETLDDPDDRALMEKAISRAREGRAPR